MAARRRSSCPTGKVRYRDQSAARVALATVQARRDGGRIEQRVYRCPLCGGWHLTSQPPRSNTA